MILVDKDIRKLGSTVITKGYNEENVGPVSYDLTLASIQTEDGEADHYEISPGETVFIKTAEQISIPYNLMGRIGEKNSRMRLGLWVSGPHYFPGHNTYMFLRVVNLSAKPIALKSGEQIAQIFFEQLTQEPEKTYDKIESASFNNEDQYRGLGKYKDEYTKEIRDTASKEQQKIEKMTDRIYANILTLMGIFVSIFSLIMVNFSNISNNGSISKQTILTINLSLGFVIALFMGLLLLFINKKPHGKMFSVVYACIMALTLICIIAFI